MAKRFPFEGDKPPRVVYILGNRVKVKVAENLHDSGNDLVGAFNADSRTIFLERGCDWRGVLLHEICHAILYFSGASEGIGYSVEERIVLALEHGLSQILFRSKK